MKFEELGVSYISAIIYCKSRNLSNTDIHNYSIDLRYFLRHPVITQFPQDAPKKVTQTLFYWVSQMSSHIFLPDVINTIGKDFSNYISVYCMSKKSCLLLYGKLLYKTGQDFADK